MHLAEELGERKLRLPCQSASSTIRLLESAWLAEPEITCSDQKRFLSTQGVCFTIRAFAATLRIRCLLELHTFTSMGADTTMLEVLPLSISNLEPSTTPGDEEDGLGKAATAEAEAVKRVRAFSLRNATCFDPREREHLLEVIASGCGGHAAFERLVKTALQPNTRRSSTTRRLSESFTRYAHPTSCLFSSYFLPITSCVHHETITRVRKASFTRDSSSPSKKSEAEDISLPISV